MDNLRRMMFVKESDIYGKGVTYSEIPTVSSGYKEIKGIWAPAICSTNMYSSSSGYACRIDFLDRNNNTIITPPSNAYGSYNTYRISINGRLILNINYNYVSDFCMMISYNNKNSAYISAVVSNTVIYLPTLNGFNDYSTAELSAKTLFDTEELMYIYIPLNQVTVYSGGLYNNVVCVVRYLNGWTNTYEGYKWYFDPA